MKKGLYSTIQMVGIVFFTLTNSFSEGMSQTTTVDLKKNKRKTLEELDRSSGVEGLRDGWNPMLAEHKLKPNDQALLSPDEELQRQHTDFLKQPGTGLFKLLNMDRVVVTADQLGAQPLYQRYRGGGSYFSFVKRRHDVDNWAQIKQLKHEFQAGTAQVDWWVSSEEAVSFKRSKTYGQSLSLFLLLGDMPLESITVQHEAVHELAALAIPTDRKSFKAKVELSEVGFKSGAYTFSSSAPIKEHTTYLLRSVIFRKVDMVVAMRVVREENDGTLHILWKEIRRTEP